LAQRSGVDAAQAKHLGPERRKHALARVRLNLHASGHQQKLALPLPGGSVVIALELVLINDLIWKRDVRGRGRSGEVEQM
jgi:hypothetical protein